MPTDTAIDFAELFFSDPTIAEDKEGLIWKPMLPEGVWKVGPNGRPLKVISGRSKNQMNEIGMQDIVDSFNDNAVAHVTIPLSHDDKVDENTGYIKKVRVGMHKGIKTLFGGHGFTDKTVAGKVKEGSIANTSVGLEFGYTRKEDGKKFPVVLRHNALTNRPWLGAKLAPFGLSETEADNYNVISLEFSEMFDEDANSDPWAKVLTYEDIKLAIAAQTHLTVEEVAFDRAMLKTSEDKQIIARFSVEDGEVEVESPSKWVERAEQKDVGTPEEDPTSTSTSTLNESVTTSEKEPPMADEKKDEKEQKPPVATAPEVKLSEHPDFIAQREENARLKAQVDQLAATNRKNEGDAFVQSLKDLGLTENKGFTGLLKYVRNIALSDQGDASLLLSEEGDAAPRPVTAFGLVKELFASFPVKDGKVTLEMAEQVKDPLNTSKDEKPPAEAEDETKLSEEELDKIADAAFAEMFPTEAKHRATALANNSKES